MSNVRVEKDLLGSREVPADAYYGIHTLRAMENFQISGQTMNDFPEFIRGMVMTKKAVALANRDLRVLPKKTAEAIVAGCDLVLDEGKAMDQFPIDMFQGGAGTSVNMNTNEVVANLALEVLGEEKGSYSVVNPNDDVNKSQSTNDAYPTGIRISIYKLIETLIEEVQALADSFGRIAEANKHVIKMGRTQLQDAVPMTVGQEFGAFRTLMEEEIRYLRQEMRLLLEVNVGATAIGTGLNTPEGFQDAAVRRLAEVSGLEVTGAPDLVEATSDTGVFVAVSGSFKRLATKTSQICNDLRLLSSGPRAGLNEINLPEMQAGSSIMPAKVNPVIPEVVNQVCYKVLGNATAVSFASEAGQLQLNVMEPLMTQCLFEDVYILRSALKTLRERCVDGITVNEDVCRDHVMNSIGIVTYLNDFIGHDEGDSIGKEAAQTGKGVREIVLERGLMTQEQLDAALSVENLMNPRYMGKIYDDE
ncbi:aspartate ammonia-lyase [Trueperella bonasi]|uniref:Aspartate ammonia-lyase n=1 Tax=Trueperella bonasi TaxID=312286 RepID=A0ABT9NHG5_9ACTO|nr:aspartate ammonia-lyase [Trueperella bonasi]MDP9806846.1 aspartate ammonia-lyase [Trueperella bonasi]